jgi:hypothetical protein
MCTKIQLEFRNERVHFEGVGGFMIWSYYNRRQRNSVRCCKLDLLGSGQGPAKRSCEQGNELSDFTKEK